MLCGLRIEACSQHGDRLGALIGGAQRLGIGDGGVGVVGIFAIAGAPDVERAPPVGVAARRVGGADRAGDVVAGGLAAGRRQGQHGRDSGRGKQTGGAGRSRTHGNPGLAFQRHSRAIKR